MKLCNLFYVFGIVYLIITISLCLFWIHPIEKEGTINSIKTYKWQDGELLIGEFEHLEAISHSNTSVFGPYKFDDGYFLKHEGTIYRSTDGINWTAFSRNYNEN